MLQLRHLYFFHHQCPGRTKRLILNHILRDHLVLSFHLQVSKVKAQIRGGTYPKPQVVRSRNTDGTQISCQSKILSSTSAFLKMYECAKCYIHTQTHVHMHTHSCTCMYMLRKVKFRKLCVLCHPLEDSVMKSPGISPTQLVDKTKLCLFLKYLHRTWAVFQSEEGEDRIY